MLAAPVLAQAQPATVTGRVTATGGSTPLADGRVMVVGTSLATLTNSEGRYTLRNVPTGNIEIRVLRVGYQEQKKPANVTAGGNVVVDFSMSQAVVQLQEIVTTATGEQRRVEIGNSISTLGDVNKLVEKGAITNLQDLLVAKAPGVILLPGNMSNSAPTVRIRGLNSLSLNNAPIYVIDGVRMNSGSIGGNVGGTNTSYVNDINPAEIEDIEIVKGPSAATLYGTDAANGVIVITTKKGKAGTTRWTFYGENGGVQDRNAYPSSYAIWGHAPAAPATQIRCSLITISQNTCVSDSLTSANLFKNKDLTVLATGPRSQYGAQASGGTDAVRFFLSADIENEIGPVRMPDVFVARFDSIKTSVRDEWRRPEAFQRTNVRANLSAALSPTVDITVSTGFGKTDQRLPQVDNNTFSFFYNGYQNPGFTHAGLGYPGVDGLGYDLHGYGLYSPAELFQRTVNQGIQRIITTADAQWRPIAWMQNQITVGMDLADRDNLVGNRFNEGPASGTTRLGTYTDTKSNDRNFSAKVTSNSSWQARQNLIMKTTFGADYVNIENDQSSANGSQLPPGAQTVGAAAIRSGQNTLNTAVKTLGLYVQEQASFRDRMFLTLAARSDQNSAFGTNFQRVLYPKASLSWILSDEPYFPKFDFLNTFRYRFAYGASGVQPGATTAFRTFQASTVNIGTPGAAVGADTPGLIANALGNPNLKPETSTEFETGFETRVFSNKLNLDLTYYRKKTKDALLNVPIAPSAGPSSTSVLQNAASVQNTGIEAQINATVIDRRAFGWDMTISASHNSNKILKVTPTCSATLAIACDSIGTGTSRQIVGKPINGRYYVPFSFNDANGDHIITPDEVTVGTKKADGTLDQVTVQYMGYSTPRDLVSIVNGFELFQRKLRISSLLDYKGGHTLFNSTTQFYCQQTNFCYDQNIKDATLADQARSVAQKSVPGTKTQIGYLENGQFWRLREVSASLQLPNMIAKRIRARDAAFVLSARNLHVWTKYKGIDPESGYGDGDIQNDFSTTSPPTVFIARLNLHY